MVFISSNSFHVPLASFTPSELRTSISGELRQSDNCDQIIKCADFLCQKPVDKIGVKGGKSGQDGSLKRLKD